MHRDYGYRARYQNRDNIIVITVINISSLSFYYFFFFFSSFFIFYFFLSFLFLLFRNRRVVNVTITFFLIKGVTILLSLTVFLNMVAETMPATSDAVPLLGNARPTERFV